MTRNSPRTYTYAARIAFVVELAEHLHAYGTTAQRLEGAVVGVAHQLGLECEPRVSPTGMVLAFSDPQRPPGESDITRVLRTGLGEVNLYKLSEADRIAEEVLAGKLDLAEGHAALLELELRRSSRAASLLHTFGFAMVAAGIAALWRLPWLDVATAAAVGLLVGLLDRATRKDVTPSPTELAAMEAKLEEALDAGCHRSSSCSTSSTARSAAPAPCPRRTRRARSVVG